MAESAAPGTPQPMKLSVGDRVVYPNQGVCRVAAIEPMEVAGQRLTFVTMKREEDGAVVRVPEAKVTAIGVRKVAGKAEINEIFTFLRSDSDRADLDWKQRARSNLERMTTGGVLGMAEVVKGLQVLSELRPLPTKERELYDNARHMLVSEMAAALDIPEINAEDAIDLILFPPGKERPKRTAEEFKRRGDGEDDLDLGDELLGLGDDLDLPSDEEEAPSEDEESSEEEGEEAEEKPAAKSKKKAAKAEAPPPRTLLSDDEFTVPMGTAFVPDEEVPQPKKRGRPPKPKTEAVAEPPKKRGRPPKPKPAEPAEPKKRGRPPKAKSEEKVAAKPAKASPAKKKK